MASLRCGLLLAVLCFAFYCETSSAHGDHAGHSHDHGQKESEDHGAGAPHEKRVHAKDHFKDGQHNVEFDHEAILGSRKEAEEFDHLPPEEAKKRLRVLAKKMDRNSDGVVDRAELTLWVEESLKQLDREEVEERFDEVDANHDGKASWAEYRKDAFGDDIQSDADITDVDDMRLLVEDKRYWDAADLDKDGLLTKHEFSAFQNPEAYDHMYEVLYINTMEEKDKDKDGFINLNEFVGDLTGKDNEWFTAEKDRFEVEYDKNKDGKLDKDEIKHWLVPSMKQTAEEEVTHLFNNVDVDKDDKLTIDEIVDGHELFVGSEATTYGDQLHNLKHDEL